MLNDKFNNCNFRQFREFGLKCAVNGHELLVSNCKFNQYEYGEECDLSTGTGLHIATNCHDNKINSCTFNYCKDS